MKSFYKILILLIILNICCFTYAADKIPITIIKIYDGDTVLAKIDKNQFSIRLIGIDCFETRKIHRAYKQAYQNNISVDEVDCKGQSSKQFLEQLYKNNQNKSVFLDFKGIDKYGRALGIVYFDSINVNKELINNGNCLKYNY